MSYFYHLKPDPMYGEDLIPLNLMPKDEDLYQSHARKYEGRESLMQQSIPLLNCKWNDVVQFSALDPQIIIDSLKLYQTDLKLFRFEYFKIHKDEVLNKYESVVFDRINPRKGTFEILDEDVQTLSSDYEEIKAVPEATVNYWKKVKNEGGKFLFFPFIPHILIKGRVDSSNFKVCHLEL